MLRKVISGGQTGADQAGLLVGTEFGMETGGWMPKGFVTLDGPRPDLAAEYNLKEHTSPSYVPRTYLNAKDSDGTIRIAGDFSSRGEKCTLNAIRQFHKPHIDVDLKDPRPPSEVAAWIKENNIATLNVAGNAEKTFPGTGVCAEKYLSLVMEELGFVRIERDTTKIPDSDEQGV
jgi:hypothetical protein